MNEERIYKYILEDSHNIEKIKTKTSNNANLLLEIYLDNEKIYGHTGFLDQYHYLLTKSYYETKGEMLTVKVINQSKTPDVNCVIELTEE